MELFSFTEADTPLLLSASESGLFLHPIHNERFGHPFLLSSGYQSGFSGCIYNNTLHYAYINKENSLLLRRLHESTLLFRLDSTDNVTYRTPLLIPLDNTLFLFYFEEELGSYRLKLRLPFSDDEPLLPEVFRTSFCELPFLSLRIAGPYLYLFLSVGTTSVSYRYSRNTSFESLCSESEFLSQLQLPCEDEKTKLEQALLRAVRLSEQQQNLLAEKEQEIKHTSQELEHTSLLLERAKSQYNELMQVAEQYRKEAMKWYGKFTGRT